MEYHTETEPKKIELGGPEATSYAPKRRSRTVFVFAIIAALIAAAYFGFSAPRGFPANGGIVTIASGEDLKILGADLQSEQYIRSSFVFDTLVSALGGEHDIAPGDYYFAKPKGVFGVARQIVSADHNLSPVKITIPEGDTVKDISAVLSEKLPAFPANDFIRQATPDEGYLFPETYFIYPKTDPASVISDMRTMFDTQTAGLFTSAALGTHTESDVVIMASLIEREAHGDDDRATISGILWKRLSLDMPLQVDATVAYAAGVSDSDLSKSDFSINSPYNTYLNKGLPPGPISNPGLAAITAALNPAQTPYLYYLHDKHGTIHYAKTYAEHMANIKKYL